MFLHLNLKIINFRKGIHEIAFPKMDDSQIEMREHMKECKLKIMNCAW